MDFKEESKHFIKCSVCSELIDMRDLKAVFDHEYKHNKNFPTLIKTYVGTPINKEQL